MPLKEETVRSFPSLQSKCWVFSITVRSAWLTTQPQHISRRLTLKQTTHLLKLCVSVDDSTCTIQYDPRAFLSIEESCVLYCRKWKMPFTLWYGRSGSTGTIRSARKKRLQAVSSLKSVLWCERGKCTQHPPALFVLLVGRLEKAVEDDNQWELELLNVLKANLLVSTRAVVKH